MGISGVNSLLKPCENSLSCALDGHAASCCASSVDENPLSVSRAIGPRVRHLQVLEQSQGHSRYSDPNSGCLFIGHAVRDLEGCSLFHDTIVSKASIVQMRSVGTVVDACNAVAGLVAFRDLGSKSNDCAGEVAPHCDSFRGEELIVDVLPKWCVSLAAKTCVMM